MGDSARAVEKNRSIWGQALGCRPVFLEQVHATDVVPVHADTPDGVVADGAWTRESGLACTVLVADCLPVVMCDADGATVSAGHAGWRGLLGLRDHGGAGVLENQFRVHSGNDVMAWLGPCIGPQAFEVGDEVRQAFIDANPEARACFVPVRTSDSHRAGMPAKWLADLPELARQRLRALGITRIFGNDGGPQWCTVNNPMDFYSFRRDRTCGRLAVSIWRSV